MKKIKEEDEKKKREKKEKKEKTPVGGPTSAMNVNAQRTRN
jgi:hypothetical protein